MKISVVIPCYRSEATLPTLVAGLHSALEAASLIDDYEVLLVVDGSPGGTADVARSLAEHPRVGATVLRRNYGQHNALLAGIRRARHEVVVTMDDDLQHSPESVPVMIAALEESGTDLVYGVAEEEEHGFWRSLASRTVKRGLRLAGVPSAEDVSALRAFRTDLRDGFSTVGDPYVSIDVLLSWTTTSISSVKVGMQEREHGESNYSTRSLIRHTLNMVTGYSTLPLRVVAWLGALFGLVGFVLLIAVVARFFIGGTAIVGWTSTVSVIAIFSGTQLISVAVLGEYVGRLHMRSMQRPTYVIRDEVDSSPNDRVG